MKKVSTSKLFYFFVALLILASAGTHAQTYLISDGGLINTCYGTFYDSGTDSSNYLDNENYTITFCSDQANEIEAYFNTMMFGAGDHLYIYDGNSTGGQLIGDLFGYPSSTSYVSTNGCLTFNFISDSIGTDLGWMANLSCLSAQPGCHVGFTSIVTDESMPGNFDGAIDLTITSGMAPYTFAWSESSTTEDILGLGAGMYTVTITDFDMCESIASFYVNDGQVCSSFSASGTVTNETSPGYFDGSIILDVIGGTPPYNYSWSNGSSDANIVNLEKGFYIATVSDANACTEILYLEVGVTCDLHIDYYNVFDATSPGGSDGSIDITVLGGNPPYSYNWSNGSTNEDIFGLMAGVYDVTISDTAGCTHYGTFNVYENTSCMNAYFNFTTEPTIGNCDGYLEVAVSGGLSPYTYMWSNGATNMYNDSLCQGTHFVTVHDADVCETVISYTLYEQGGCTMSAYEMSHMDESGPAMCDGSIELSVNNFVPPLSFNWSNGMTTQNIYGLCNSYYYVTVTDNNACQWYGGFQINTMQAECMAVSSNMINDATMGNCDGYIDLYVSGGMPPYTYIWSNGATDYFADSLCYGEYFVTVSDMDTCQVVKSFWIYEYTPPCMDVMIMSQVDAAQGMCDGYLELSVSGGMPPYTYMWSNGATNAFIDSLCYGPYDVTIQDANSCVITNSYWIYEQGSCNISAYEMSHMDESGPAMCDGFIELSVNNFVPPLSFNWSNGMTTQNIYALCNGYYNVTITDYNGCQWFGGFPLNTMQQSCMNVSTNMYNDATPGNCDGYIDLYISGGMPPYTYMWSNGATDYFADSLCYGEYFVTVSDMDTCQVVQSFWIYEYTPPCMDVMTISQVDATQGMCNGYLELSVSGGMPPYSYNWSNGSTNAFIDSLCYGPYDVTIHDADSCVFTNSYWIYEQGSCNISAYEIGHMDESNPGMCDGYIELNVSGYVPPLTFAWSNGMTTQNIYGLCNNYYNVTVTDYNGCQWFGGFPVNTMQAACMDVAVNIMPVTYSGGNNGAIELFVNGGMPPYNFMWSSGQTTPSIYNLYMGMYSVTISSADSCTVTQSYYIEEMPGDTLCNIYATFMWDTVASTSEIQFIAMGQGPITGYKWNFGDGTTSTQMNPVHVFPGPGYYWVCLTVFDNSVGCMSDYCMDVFIDGQGSNMCFANFNFFVEETTNTVYFADSSLGNVSQFHWSFGDGTYSNNPMPVHVYPNNGYYDVCLTTFDSVSGCQSQMCQNVLIGGSSTCFADFFFFTDSTNTVYFDEESSAGTTDWYWEFGDGNYSYEKNPVHTYANSGFYNVCLMTFDTLGFCQANICKDVQIGDMSAVGICQAKFSFFVDNTTGVVNFHDESAALNNLEYFWDFGDGQFSELKNPSHAYPNQGFYNVCLFILNPVNGCVSDFCKEIMIGDGTGGNLCNAQFSFYINQNTNTVSFQNQSTGTSGFWSWSFGDGGFSNQQNPSYQFANPGFWPVCLFMHDTLNNCISEECIDIQVGDINANSTCQSKFIYVVNPTQMKVTFTQQALGNITSYYWLFGDGTTSTNPNPVKYYSQPGYYYVELVVQNQATGCVHHFGTDIQVGSYSCNAKFISAANPGTNQVSFTDVSTGGAHECFWDFGDGDFEFVQNPVHQYTAPGMYFVCLTMIDTVSGCVDDFCKEVQVGTINCNANFTTFVDSVSNTAFFQNQVLGPLTNLYWEFGDGASSTALNPQHHYTVPGIYHVSLSTYNNSTGCMDFFATDVVIGNIGMDCLAKFTMQPNFTTNEVKFFDNSVAGNISEYIWNFGDGTTSNLPNPTHQYANGGFYNVCLTIYDYMGGCQNSKCKVLQLGTNDNYCHADFIYSVDSMTMEVAFVETASGNITDYFWDFGDGQTSVDANPVHIYSAPGFYPVSLVVFNANAGCDDYALNYINVAAGDMGLECIFGYQVDSTNLKANEYTVDFVGAAFGEPAAFNWEFGDGFGEDSTTLCPTYGYSSTGTYNVCFTIYDPLTGDSDTYCQDIDVQDPLGRSILIDNQVTANAYPNPFNESTTIVYNLTVEDDIEVAIYNMMGAKVATLYSGPKTDGRHTIVWEKGDNASGIYYLTITSGNSSITKKLVVIDK